MPIPYTEFPSDDSALLTCCQRACPVGTDVANYIALIAQGRFAEAIMIVREENPFPSICGRVCDHLCEQHCRRGESDGPVAIRALKRFIADRERSGEVRWPDKIVASQSKKVAIIGSGPAGLTAACDLLRRGYGVTVFEALAQAGGMMRVGIPDYRLPREILDFDLEYLQRLGVEIELNKALGRDFTLDALKQRGYDAILLATGTHGSSPLKIEGVDLNGVSLGIDFLREVNLGGDVHVGEHVVVIGGGDVAIDTARTALRLGGKEVSVFCLESRDQMPAHDWETREALDEEIKFNCSWGPVKFVGDDSIRQVEFVACTSVFDSSGKFAPSFDTAQRHTAQADTVLIAIGQYAEFSHAAQDRIETTANRLYRVDDATLATTNAAVFAAGDAAYGTATVIKAVASGHRASASICEYLEGRELTGQWSPTIHTERIDRIEIRAGWEELGPLEEPELTTKKRVQSFSEVKLGLTEAVAMGEAARCMRCDYETGSHTYPRALRETIYHLSRDIASDEDACLDFLKRRLAQSRREAPQAQATARLDDLVFLPATLTRLVIDPYREACRIKTIIGPRTTKPLELAGPVIIGGLAFADLSENELRALCEGAQQSQIAVRAPGPVKLPVAELPVIRIVSFDDAPEAITDAGAIELSRPEQSKAVDPAALADAIKAWRKASPKVPIGLTIGPKHVAADMKTATDTGLDFVTLIAMDPANAGANSDAIELDGTPRIDVLTQTMQSLRALKREEDIDILYFGGVRGGGDLAKVLALCANAAIIGQAALIAAGDCREPSSVPESAEGVSNFVQSMFMEASILARSCGKTDVHNLEPEDLRSLSATTSSATAIPLVGKDRLYAGNAVQARA